MKSRMFIGHTTNLSHRSYEQIHSGATEIARHPRNIESLVRRQDSSRKDERERRKARKEEELRKKKEEVKRLKALKMKELRAKLERIGVEGGKNLEETTGMSLPPI